MDFERSTEYLEAMAGHHDQASQSLAESSMKKRPANAPDAESGNGASPGRDPLSDVLRVVKLTGALFFIVDATSPWGVDIPNAKEFASIILPRAQHIVSYHIVLQGSGIASISGHPAVHFAAGDVLVFPHGDPYAMLSAPGDAAELNSENALDFFRAMAAGKLPFVITEGGGGSERAKFVCGFLGCDVRPFNPLLAALPRLMHVRSREHGKGDLLDRLIELTLAETQTRRIGGECLRLRLSELLFIETILRHLATLTAGDTGWLAGLRDPGVGRALALIHERPEHSWTLEGLAREAGMSRSLLAQRFMHLVGMPPMQYLTQWRVQVASRLLTDGISKVGTVGSKVGYASEAAFSRTFKKVAGMPPAQWRERAAAKVDAK
jgi:AraC-like DNA-binding protein